VRRFVEELNYTVLWRGCFDDVTMKHVRFDDDTTKARVRTRATKVLFFIFSA
jgi:hypothetical protein